MGERSPVAPPIREDAAGRRAQTSLPALGVALLVVAVVTVLGLSMANGALTGADRDPADTRTARSLADGLVARDSPLTTRANVLDRGRLDAVDGTWLESRYPAVEHANGVRITLGDETFATTGETTDGARFTRLVVVRSKETRTVRPPLTRTETVTLPQRTRSATLRIEPPGDVTVHAVTAGDRFVLRNRDGLSGTYELSLSRFATTVLRFRADGGLTRGDVVVTYPAIRTEKTTLGVQADA